MAWIAPRTWAVGEALTAQRMNEQLRDNMIANTPVVGEIKMFMRQPTSVETVIGVNWLECNGVAVSRSNYSLLYNLCNTMRTPRGFGTTQLATAMDALQTTLTLTAYPDTWPGDQANNTNNWWDRTWSLQQPYLIRIDNENMLVTGIDAYPHTTLSVVRGREGTLAATHNANATVSLFNDLPFGSGDGATTFHLPDLHGRTPWSAARSGGHVDVGTIGLDDRARLGARRPKHRHENTVAGSGAGGSQSPFAWGTLGSGQPLWSMPGGLSNYNQYGAYIGPLDEAGFYPDNFAGTTTPVDAPGYVVTGVWGIRFVGV